MCNQQLGLSQALSSPAVANYVARHATTPSQSVTVEVSALVPTESSGAVWTLSIDDGNNGSHVPGIFSSVGTNWTTVSAEFLGGDVAGFVDANGEMQLTVSCSEPDSTQVGRFEYMVAVMGTHSSGRFSLFLSRQSGCETFSWLPTLLREGSRAR